MSIIHRKVIASAFIPSSCRDDLLLYTYCAIRQLIQSQFSANPFATVDPPKCCEGSDSCDILILIRAALQRLMFFAPEPWGL